MFCISKIHNVYILYTHTSLLLLYALLEASIFRGLLRLLGTFLGAALAVGSQLLGGDVWGFTTSSMSLQWVLRQLEYGETDIYIYMSIYLFTYL